MDNQITSIRCPGEREHGVYKTCNHLIGALQDGEIILFCSQCKQFYKIEIHDNDNVVMTPIDKQTRLNLKTRLKVIE